MTNEALPSARMSKKRLSFAKLTSRSLLGGLLAGGVAAFSFGSIADAQTIAGFNSNQPVSVDAGSIDLQDNQNRVVFSGGVVIKQGDLTLTAARTTLAYSDAGSLEIQRIDATGGVTVTRGGEKASGDAGIYDLGRRVIILSGNVELRKGNDNLNGGRLVIDLNSGLSSVDGAGANGSNGSGNGRVTGTFTVPQ